MRWYETYHTCISVFFENRSRIFIDIMIPIIKCYEKALTGHSVTSYICRAESVPSFVCKMPHLLVKFFWWYGEIFCGDICEACIGAYMMVHEYRELWRITLTYYFFHIFSFSLCSHAKKYWTQDSKESYNYVYPVSKHRKWVIGMIHGGEGSFVLNGKTSRFEPGELPWMAIRVVVGSS